VKKNRTKGLLREAAPERIGLPGILIDTRKALRELVMSSGLAVFTRMLEDDRTALCGPRHRPSPDRSAYRHGHDKGSLVFGGRKVRLRKPRVRSVAGEEIELPTWEQMSAEDPLRDRIVEQTLLGVSSRGYERSLEPLPDEVRSHTTKRSSVCRRFVARTTAQVEAFLSRPLGDLDFPVILIDGTGLGDHVLIVAMGIDTAGHKHILGVAVGTTESEQAIRSLFRNLIERGLVVERARLFVIDGGKGLKKAIRITFGDWALIQRCQVHKLRNVAEHLPKHRQPWVKAAMRKAWRSGTVATARQRLTHLAEQLDAEHPDAAASVREGLEETLTLLRLGIGGALHQTLCSTNPIENLQGALKRIVRNVKRWRGGSMALRWCATALVEAEKRFRRLRGHREMPQLIAALEAVVNKNSLDTKQQVA
jgi:transposase-like protein